MYTVLFSWKQFWMEDDETKINSFYCRFFYFEDMLYLRKRQAVLALKEPPSFFWFLCSWDHFAHGTLEWTIFLPWKVCAIKKKEQNKALQRQPFSVDWCQSAVFFILTVTGPSYPHSEDKIQNFRTPTHLSSSRINAQELKMHIWGQNSALSC